MAESGSATSMRYLPPVSAEDAGAKVTVPSAPVVAVCVWPESSRRATFTPAIPGSRTLSYAPFAFTSVTTRTVTVPSPVPFDRADTGPYPCAVGAVAAHRASVSPAASRRAPGLSLSMRFLVSWSGLLSYV